MREISAWGVSLAFSFSWRCTILSNFERSQLRTAARQLMTHAQFHHIYRVINKLQWCKVLAIVLLHGMDAGIALLDRLFIYGKKRSCPHAMDLD